MVLELRIPHANNLASLRPLFPVFLSYLLSFIFIGIYWSNHHHLIQAADKVNGPILWANLHLLFWLSLVPFVTAWMGLNGNSEGPVALYGVVLLFSGIAYFILVRVLIRYHGKSSVLARALGKDVKGQTSVLAYLIAIGLAFYNPLFSYALYVGVALMWLTPDSRIEKVLLK
jgi:uncharacterized membrane protein